MRGGLEVLLIDDEAEYLELATGYFDANAPHVTLRATTDPTAALQEIENRDFDCVVSDYEMPEMSGLEILEEVRTDAPTLPFIVLTGEGSEEVASEFISAGVTDYVLKGGRGQFEDLLDRVDEAAAEYRRAQFVERANERPVDVIERVTDAFYAVDEDWQFTYLNSAAEELFDVAADELLGDSLWEQLPGATETPFFEAFHEAMDAGEPKSIQARYGPWDRWFRAHLYPSEEGLSVIAHDITEQKKQEDALRHQRDQLDEFASMVSHDLRNPLNVALGRLELVAEDCDSEHTEHIDDALNRIQSIIDDLLALARQGESVTQIVPLDVTEIVKDAWASAGNDQAEMRVETDLQLYADENQLIRVFENLFRNAVEHGGPDVTVRIGTLEDAHGFYIADDGPGIPPEEREAVWERGYTGTEDGTGLGLPIVKRIVDAHDWQIDMDESEDSGARIEIRFG